MLFRSGGAISSSFNAIVLSAWIPNSSSTLQAVKASRGRNGSVTPTLDQYSRDLTEMEEEGKLDPVVGRDKEIARLIQILSRRTKNNPCLIGEPGVGKTAIVEGIAERITTGMVPDTVAVHR